MITFLHKPACGVHALYCSHITPCSASDLRVDGQMFCAGEELIEAAKRNDFCKVLTSQSWAMPLEALTLGGSGPLSSVISWSSMALPCLGGF